jgi:predicted secreted protein
MKQTAVEWLVQQLSKEWQLEDRDLHLIQQAKEMEKEQIIDAFNNGFSTTQWDKIKENKAEQYYNETFKSE